MDRGQAIYFGFFGRRVFSALPLRVEFSGALCHLSTRENARQPIIIDDDDPKLLFTNPCSRNPVAVFRSNPQWAMLS
jgi:hypothetical protein